MKALLLYILTLLLVWGNSLSSWDKMVSPSSLISSLVDNDIDVSICLLVVYLFRSFACF